MFEIKDPMGLHARPASMIFMEARKYRCTIEAQWRAEKADCKSLLSLMGLEVMGGDAVLFRFDGEDEEAAAAAVKAVLERL
ncbi:HPr family phosphocarrier protein [Lachnospiraceae bacterium 54-53]